LKKIIDEFTDRKDLTAQQKYYLRNIEAAKNRSKNWLKDNPERRKEIESKHERKKWASMSAEDRADRHLGKRYKITFKQFDEMIKGQDNGCYLCDAPIQPIGDYNIRGVLDHNHETGKIRKVLCQHCNKALGLVKEKVDVLKKMVKYLDGTV
jgi:preprotein translocase subunit SecD